METAKGARESDREMEGERERERENAGSTQRHQRTRRLLFICCCSSLLSRAKQAVGCRAGTAGQSVRLSQLRSDPFSISRRGCQEEVSIKFAVVLA